MSDQVSIVWNMLFSDQANLQTLSCFRFIFGTLLSWNCFTSAKNAWIYYSDVGAFPTSTVRSLMWTRRYSFYFLFPSAASAFWLSCLLCLSSLMFTVGLFSVLFGPLCFLLLISKKARNPLVMDHGDSLAILMLLYLVLSDSAHFFSMDRYLELPTWGFTLYWIQFLMQLQIILIYFNSLCHKLRDESWMEGSAVLYLLSRNELGGNLKIGRSFFKKRVFSSGASWIILGTQALIPVGLLFEETRMPGLIIAAIFHTFFLGLLPAKKFHLYMLCSLIVFTDIQLRVGLQ